MRFNRLGTIGLGLVMTLAACGSDEDDNNSGGTADSGVADATTGADATVAPTVEVKVNSFTADPATVLTGRTSVLSWSVQGPTGTTVTIKQGSTTIVDAVTTLVGTIATNPIVGAVGDKTSFTLTATAGDDSATETTEVSIRAVNTDALPAINSLTGTQDASIRTFTLFGSTYVIVGTIEVAWDVSSATTITLTDAAGASAAEVTDASGTTEVKMPSGTYRQTLTLTATNDEGSVTQDVEIGTVGYVFSGYAVPSFTVEASEDVKLSWQVAGDVSLMTHDPAAVGDHSGDTAVDGIAADATGATFAVTEAVDYLVSATQFGNTATSTISVPRGVSEAGTAGQTYTDDTYIRGTGPHTDQDVYRFNLRGGDYIGTLVTDINVAKCQGTIRIYRGSDASAIDDENLVGAVGNYTCSWNYDDAEEGDYIVVVTPPEGATADTVYALQVGITPAACGDSYVTVNSGEECDDKNTDADDGCSATCKIEYLSDDPLEVAGTGEDTDTVTGQNVAEGQLGYYHLNAAADRVVTISTADADGSCIEKMRLGVLAPNLSIYTTADSDAEGNCPSITTALGGADFVPYGETAAADGSGQYIAALVSNHAGAGLDNVSITTTPLATTFPVVTSATAERVALSTRDDLPGIALLTLTEPTSVGIQAWNADVTNPAGTATTAFCAADKTPGLAIQTRALYNDLTAFATKPTSGVIAAIGSSTAACPSLDATSNTDLAALPAGKYMVAYLNYKGTAGEEGPNIKSAELAFSFNAVECGNGILENREGVATEECDDGNRVDDDVCSNTCVWGGQVEKEPNNMADTANDINVPGYPMKGEVTSGDKDVFKFTLTEETDLVFQTAGAQLGTCLGDSVIGIFDAAGTQLAANDDSDEVPGYCSYLEYTAAAGTYYVVVQGYRGAAAGPYFLHNSASTAD